LWEAVTIVDTLLAQYLIVEYNGETQFDPSCFVDEDGTAELVVIRNISMPLMLSSLSHDIATGKLLGVA
jgi:hypothetical protein